jgi:3-methyl-2-oxobutanoate hydroxymethyltransferase
MSHVKNAAAEPQTTREKRTIPGLLAQHAAGERLTMLTAYDFTAAMLVDQAGIDLILVGDSLAMVMLGHEDTVSVTMEEMLHHCRAVARGAPVAVRVGDMPFMSYGVDVAETIRNAGRFLKEGHMEAVKMEGAGPVVEHAHAVVAANIPVMGHLGLTPQSVAKLGGYRVQGRTARAARELLDDALRLEDAGCFALVLEAIPGPVAEVITRRLTIPTIGIGAGAGCSGQVLVFHDLLGLYDRFVPRFVRQYAQLNEVIGAAVAAYGEDVRSGAFPGPEHTYEMKETELALWQEAPPADPGRFPEEPRT